MTVSLYLELPIASVRSWNPNKRHGHWGSLASARQALLLDAYYGLQGRNGNDAAKQRLTGCRLNALAVGGKEWDDDYLIAALLPERDVQVLEHPHRRFIEKPEVAVHRMRVGSFRPRIRHDADQLRFEFPGVWSLFLALDPREADQLKKPFPVVRMQAAPIRVAAEMFHALPKFVADSHGRLLSWVNSIGAGMESTA